MDGYNTIGRNASLFNVFDVNLLKRIRDRSRVKLDGVVKMEPGSYIIQNGYIYKN